MRWIDRVELLGSEDDVAPTTAPARSPVVNSLSRWVCSTTGFEVAWVARIESVVEDEAGKELRWCTVEGLRSSGRVRFMHSRSSSGTTVELTATLKSDLEHFQQYAASLVGGASATI
eukprot:SM000214S06782  [mRNA]  locus=s214:231324:232384:+ [translate_table: standard]